MSTHGCSDRDCTDQSQSTPRAETAESFSTEWQWQRVYSAARYCRRRNRNTGSLHRVVLADSSGSPGRRGFGSCKQAGQSPRAVLQALVAGNLHLAHTQTLITSYQLLEQRLAALMPLDVGQPVDALFPDGRADVATVRQAALLIVPNVNTPRELL